MTCPDCGTPVELKVLREPGERRRPFLVDAEGSGFRRHYCPPPELDTEQIDRCLTCRAWYLRINSGERLDLATRTPHVCQPVAPVAPPRMPDPPRQVSVEPPRRWPEPARETKFL